MRESCVPVGDVEYGISFPINHCLSYNIHGSCPVRRDSVINEVIIDVTNKCVMNCLYCGTRIIGKDDADIDFELFESLIESLRDFGETTVFLGGGTFFCHPQWEELLGLLNSCDQIFVIDCPLDRNILNRIYANQPSEFNYHPSLSLWGVNAVHDKLCGKASFHLLSGYMRKQSKWPIPLRLSFVMTKNLIQQTQDIIDFAEQLPTDTCLYFHRLMPIGGGIHAKLPALDSLIHFRNRIVSAINITKTVTFHHTLDDTCRARTNHRIFINHDGRVYKCGWIDTESIPICKLRRDSTMDFCQLFRKANSMDIQCVLKRDEKAIRGAS